MSKKQINATLYMESKIVFKRKDGNVVINNPDGYLFAHGRYPTKILSSDLPEWYIYGYMYKRHGYMSAKGVKHLLYVPNYVFDNHLHKYDTLYISYNAEIEPYETERGSIWYKGYDNAIGGSLIAEFVEAARKYSGYNVKDIQKEIARKREFYYDRNPEEAKALVKSPLSDKFGSRLPYRGRDYWLGGVVERKPFFDNAFCVPVNYSSEKIKIACIQIYRALAKQDLTAKVQEYAARMGVKPTRLKINSAKNCLISCNSTNTLNFSWRLIMADDVIVYELAHILEHKNSSNFWKIVSDILPDHKTRQVKLKEFKGKLIKEIL